MPIIPQTYACDNCGANSGPEPYLWYVVLTPAKELLYAHISQIEIRHLHPGTIYPSNTEFTCGESCLYVRVSQLLGRLETEPPNPQMETFTLPAVNPSPAALAVLESYARRYSGYNPPKEGAAPTNRKD